MAVKKVKLDKRELDKVIENLSGYDLAKMIPVILRELATDIERANKYNFKGVRVSQTCSENWDKIVQERSYMLGKLVSKLTTENEGEAVLEKLRCIDDRIGRA